jgi:hypothetical protein
MRKFGGLLLPVVVACGVAITLPYASGLFGAERPSAEWTVLPYHLTARPWKPANVPREQYLEIVEGICRFTIQHQNDTGAIIDPFLKREHQYATPYFAHAVGTLVHAGKALDLLPHGVKAMEHATVSFGNGKPGVPDNHGEFFIAALTGALPLYEKHIPAAQFANWR